MVNNAIIPTISASHTSAEPVHHRPYHGAHEVLRTHAAGEG